MGIPSYKKVHIISEKKEEIFRQLESFQYGRTPYIFIVEHLGKAQEQVIDFIQEFVQMYSVNITTYPINIIASINAPNSILSVFPSIEAVPKFYNQKIKQLNVQENNLLKKVILKQNNLHNIRESECLPTLKEYSKSHKALYQLEKEKEFLSKLSVKLEEQYEQKWW